ncbi:prolyl 4-hydroxylase alpha-subunit [Aureococcus anophagefferens]|nr:prolyl 4-hydroxylase alpha-subunit [Aureococcus anophagefferens]
MLVENDEASDDGTEPTAPVFDALPVVAHRPECADFAELTGRATDGLYAVVVDGVLSRAECAALVAATERRGYVPALLNKGRGRGPRAVVRQRRPRIVGDQRLARLIFDRVRPFVEPSRGRWRLVGANERLRFLKYAAGDFFKLHGDGSYVRGAGPRRGETSFVTLLVYLNDGADYASGRTTLLSADDGRTAYFQTADLEKRTFLELGEWVATHSRTPPRRGHDGRTKLWIELDNAQTKILSGWGGGAPDCADGPGCFGGVDESSLERAKAAIRDKFDRALVVEWLDTPQSVDWLSQLFAGPTPRRPAAREKAAFRAARRENASWWRAERSVLADIDARNQLDLRLWTWAAGEFRNAVAASWGSHRRPPPPLPPLPCVDAGAHCWSSDAHPPVRDLAVLQ